MYPWFSLCHEDAWTRYASVLGVGDGVGDRAGVGVGDAVVDRAGVGVGVAIM